MVLFGADDEGAAGGFDDFEGDDLESVDLHDAFDLGEQALYEAKVVPGDAADGGDGLGVGEVVEAEAQAEASPVRVRTKVSSSSFNGRYWWANPIRL